MADLSASIYSRMLRLGLDPAPCRWPEVVSAMRSGTMPGDRGWILQGGVGSGKTTRALIASRLCGVEMASAAELFDLFASAGVVSAARIPGWRASCRCDGCDLIIDDVGAEPPSMRIYGEPRHPLAEILEARLNLWPRVRTYLTTNLTGEDLEARYGARVASRLAGACITITLDAPDWRRRPDCAPPMQ